LNLSIYKKSLILLFVLVIFSSYTAKSQDIDEVVFDPHELEFFLDGVILSQLESHQVAGAVVSVVKDGEIFFSKGYGYADVAANRQVFSDQTLFRPGSITKLVVWTAVMQLVERGMLDLDVDIQNYLDFSIPDTYPQPITMSHLLTHTAGFEEAGLGTFVLEREEMMPLGDYLRENVPARIFPPGEIAAYSNYGAALAGYIVERISGMLYEDFILENIFRPLQMDNSTLDQPLPPDLALQLSKGYSRQAGVFVEGRFEYVQAAPGGALSSTGDDMANFMIAHLERGRFQDAQILQEDTVQLMHSRQFSHHPDVGGMAYGWMENEFNGQQVVWHGGNTVFFHSILLLLPDHDIGLFVSYNSMGGGQASILLMNAFMDRYFPYERPTLFPDPDPVSLDRYTGRYIPSRHNVTDIAKTLLLIQSVNVSETADGILRVTGLGFEPTYWEPAGELSFRNIESPHLLVFDTDEAETIDRFYVSNFSPVAFLRTPWHASPSFHYLLLAITLPVFLITLLALPMSYFSTLHYRRRTNETPPVAARLASWFAWLYSLLSVMIVVGLTVLLSDPEIILGIPPWGEYLLPLPWVLLGLALVIPVLAGVVWVRGYWSSLGRALYTIFTLSALVFVFFLVYWNIL
jgi:CubicO group peptidase (beta-lactamase class C family)